MNDWDFWFATGTTLLDRERFDSDRLVRDGRMERWGHRARIHHRGEGDELYVVLKGGVEIHGDSQVRLKAGDLFGLTDRRADPRFQAYDETTIVAVERPLFESLTEDNGLVLSTRMRQKLRFIEVRVDLPFDDVIGVGPVERLARVLRSVAENHGEEVGGKFLLPNLKPRHYSSLSALDRQSTRRALDALEERTLIDRSGGSLVVPDLDSLLDEWKDVS